MKEIENKGQMYKLNMSLSSIDYFLPCLFNPIPVFLTMFFMFCFSVIFSMANKRENFNIFAYSISFPLLSCKLQMEDKESLTSGL